MDLVLDALGGKPDGSRHELIQEALLADQADHCIVNVPTPLKEGTKGGHPKADDGVGHAA